jgi:MFS family permease
VPAAPDRALALGAQGLCFSLPIAILPLFTGVLADRFDRLSLVKATLAAEAAQAFGLAAVTATGNLHPWMLYLAAVADASRLAVNIPAQSALVPGVVPPRLLLSALALSGSTWRSSALVGPAAVETLLPVFAAHAWHTGPAGYGLLRMTPGIAAIVAGIGLPMAPSAVRHPLTLPAAFAVAGVAIAAFAAGPPFILALFLLAAGSLGLTVTQATAGTIIQQSTPDAMRGRITALGSAGQNGLAGLAAAATAGLAAGAGPGLATAVMAAVTVGGGIPWPCSPRGTRMR